MTGIPQCDDCFRTVMTVFRLLPPLDICGEPFDSHFEVQMEVTALPPGHCLEWRSKSHRQSVNTLFVIGGSFGDFTGIPQC